MIILWGFVFLLSTAVIFLTWMQFKNQGDEVFKQSEHVQLDQKVVNLEQNLKKTLEIMQDLAKKMHTQQEVLDQTTHKLQQVELQNAELVTLLAKVVIPKE
ncbi:hypothetical protein D9K79_16620 [Acinetobacter cumulans]|uniref:DUF2570 domain-containing protein n=1 Tax=Acinetobacter cumulans TaxID=2136182 RepID=A0ABX9U1S2_9GAMM|nr:hypothetical protein [Acinetobacter cumulans]RLL38144.1 hypothetical protein D9K79_16620 [Acinetobacter cumulans]